MSGSIHKVIYSIHKPTQGSAVYTADTQYRDTVYSIDSIVYGTERHSIQRHGIQIHSIERHSKQIYNIQRQSI